MSGSPKAPTVSRRLATQHAEADASIGLLLWQVTNQWQSAQRAALKRFDLTHVQFVLLASITWLESDSPVTQRHVAEHAVTDPMMTSQVLRTLESRGLVRRGHHPTDSRARALSVTDAGQQIVNRAIVAVEACDRAFFAVLEDEAVFAAQLRALRNQVPQPTGT